MSYRTSPLPNITNSCVPFTYISYWLSQKSRVLNIQKNKMTFKNVNLRIQYYNTRNTDVGLGYQKIPSYHYTHNVSLLGNHRTHRSRDYEIMRWVLRQNGPKLQLGLGKGGTGQRGRRHGGPFFTTAGANMEFSEGKFFGIFIPSSNSNHNLWIYWRCSLMTTKKYTVYKVKNNGFCTLV